MVGYPQNISEIKHGKNTSFFDFLLQLEHGFMRAICFTPENRPFPLNKAETLSPVKLKKYTKSPSIHDSNFQELKLNKYCIYQEPSPAEASFPYQQINKTTIILINDIPSLSPYQLIKVQGKLVIPSRPLSDNTTYNRLSATIVDATSSIKISLWDTNREAVENNQFYTLENVQVRIYQGRRYLSTTDCTIITASDSFPVADLQNDEFVTIYRAVVNGVEHCTHYHACFGCGRKLNQPVTEIAATVKCDICKMAMRSNKCLLKLSATLIVSTNTTEKLYLTLFDNCLHALPPPDSISQMTT